MTKHDQGDRANTPTAGPGESLRFSREKRGLSVEDVAEELHLRPSIVTAIEHENYDLLPGVIFLKGYIRSYSSLLGLNEDEMVKLLDSQFNQEAIEQASRQDALVKAKIKKRSKHAITVMVCAVIVGFGLYFWSQQLGDSVEVSSKATSLDDKSVSTDTSNSTHQGVNRITDSHEPETVIQTIDDKSSGELVDDTKVIDSSIDMPVNPAASVSVAVEPIDDVEAVNKVSESDALLSVDNNDSALEDEALALEKASDEPKADSQDALKALPLQLPAETKLSTPSETVVEEVIPVEPSVSDNSNLERLSKKADANNTAEESDVVAIDSGVPVKASEPIKELGTGSVVVTFSGDCWFTLANGEGKTVIAGLKKAGDDVNYSGPLPFKLLVGAVSEVTVVFDGEPVDLSKVKVWNNRAELELTH